MIEGELQIMRGAEIATLTVKEEEGVSTMEEEIEKEISEEDQ